MCIKMDMRRISDAASSMQSLVRSSIRGFTNSMTNENTNNQKESEKTKPRSNIDEELMEVPVMEGDLTVVPKQQGKVSCLS